MKPFLLAIVMATPILAMLVGCQPEGSAQQSGASAPAAPAVQQLAAGNATMPAVSRADALKLAKDIGCLSCHSIDKKLLGPAWKHVAAVNRGDPTAEARMLNKIAKGGSGVWGNIDMPAYPDLSESNRRILVEFILSLE